jgi:hypothetical protein
MAISTTHTERDLRGNRIIGTLLTTVDGREKMLIANNNSMKSDWGNALFIIKATVYAVTDFNTLQKMDLSVLQKTKAKPSKVKGNLIVIHNDSNENVIIEKGSSFNIENSKFVVQSNDILKLNLLK